MGCTPSDGRETKNIMYLMVSEHSAREKNKNNSTILFFDENTTRDVLLYDDEQNARTHYCFVPTQQYTNNGMRCLHVYNIINSLRGSQPFVQQNLYVE